MSYQAMMASQGKPTPHRVPDDYGDYWQDCMTVVCLESCPQHPDVPPWYTNQQYPNSKYTWWQRYVRHSGFVAAVKARQAFIDGFTDVRGNHWCGQCYHQREMINLGEQLGYPDVHRLYALVETRNAAGYEAWLRLARFGGCVLVENVERVARALLVQRSHLLREGRAA